jgi:hypothetical protein
MFLTIRCHHLFTCVVAMTYLRQIEIKMGAAGHNRMAEEIMNDILHFFAKVSEPVYVVRSGLDRRKTRHHSCFFKVENTHSDESYFY